MKKPINLLSQYRLILVVVVAISCQGRNDSESQSQTDSISVSLANTSLDVINKKISEDPANPELLYSRALLYIDLKRYEEALTDMRGVLSLDSTKSVYYITMADLSMAANRTFNAKMFLERAIAIDPENHKASLRLAELNFIVRRYPESLEILNRLIAKDKSDTTALLMRGFIFKENGDTNRAISDFRTAVESNPDFYAAYHQLGMIFQLKNDPICEGYFSNAIRVRPNSEEALYGRGLWYQEHDHYDKAIQDYTTIIKINPRNKSAHFNLGYLHQVYLKVYAEAVKHFTRAIEVDTKYAEAYLNRGLCYESMGNINAAKKDYEMALVNRPRYRLAEEGIARVSK
ncbi:MAG: tetratricopeptide repeat protein [Bacteroidota bacterium]